MLVPSGGNLRDKTWCLELRMGWKGAIGGARRPLAWRWWGSTVWKERETGAGWSKADPGIVVTSDEGGRAVAVSDLVTNTTRSLVYSRNTIFSLACHPDDPDLVAIGCKSGLVLLVSATGVRLCTAWRGAPAWR